MHGHDVTGRLTISSAPLMTPQRTLLNHSPPSRASRGSSANSARGFSSSVSTNSDGWGSDCAPGPRGGGAEGVGKETEGAMFRKILNATCGAALVQLIPPVSAQPERRAFFFDTMGGGGEEEGGRYLGDDLGGLRERLASLEARTSEEVLDQPGADVVSPLSRRARQLAMLRATSGRHTSYPAAC